MCADAVVVVVVNIQDAVVCLDVAVMAACAAVAAVGAAAAALLWCV